MARTSHAWSDEREKELVKWFEYKTPDGYLSHAAIAKKMGENLSRNAIIGKLHRMGLHRPPNTRCQSVVGKAVVINKPKVTYLKTPTRPPRPVSGPRLVASPVDLAPPPDPSATALSILELTPSTCHFPMGNPGEEGFHYCGASVKIPHEQSYCPYHYRLTHQPVRKRDKNRPSEVTWFNKISRYA